MLALLAKNEKDLTYDGHKSREIRSAINTKKRVNNRLLCTSVFFLLSRNFSPHTMRLISTSSCGTRYRFFIISFLLDAIMRHLNFTTHLHLIWYFHFHSLAKYYFSSVFSNNNKWKYPPSHAVFLIRYSRCAQLP